MDAHAACRRSSPRLQLTGAEISPLLSPLLSSQVKSKDLIIVLTYKRIQDEIFVRSCCCLIASPDGGNWILCSQVNDDCELSY